MRGREDFDKAFVAITNQHSDGLYVSTDSLIRDNAKRIATFALNSRLPSMFPYREGVDAGGLMSYGADLADSYRRFAYCVERIVKGAKPAEMPVEQPKKLELAINLKTAQQIGVTIPPQLLARADR